MIAERNIFESGWNPSAAPTSRPRRRILLADDQDNIRRLVAATLGTDQFELLYAKNGEEALNLALEHAPDLVLLDVEMPIIDGYEVCRAIKRHSATERTRVIMLTGKATDEDKTRGREAGADDYIAKPFSPLMLLRTVQSTVNTAPLRPRQDPDAQPTSAKIIALPGTTPNALLASDILQSSLHGIAAPPPKLETTLTAEAMQRSVFHIENMDNPAEMKVRELEISQRQLLIYAEELNQAYHELQSTYFSTLQALAAAIDARDPYTFGHSQRVAAYGVEIGRMMGLDSDDLETIRRAGLLHDIGKIAVPDATLRKPGRLNEEEWQQIRRHPDDGYQIVSQLKFLLDAAPFIRCHHERWDGRGYPQGLHGDHIPLGARILSVADSFDAMTSTRPYRPALTLDDARREAELGRLTQFDTHVVDAFQEAILTIEEIMVRDAARLR